MKHFFVILMHYKRKNEIEVVRHITHVVVLRRGIRWKYPRGRPALSIADRPALHQFFTPCMCLHPGSMQPIAAAITPQQDRVPGYCTPPTVRVCLVAWSISELLSQLGQADFNMFELRFWCVFGRLYVLRNAEFILCLVGCMGWDILWSSKICTNTPTYIDKKQSSPVYTNKKQSDP
jgi:hypothetical protein